MTRLWLEEGFCPRDNYQCLMPVAYEPVESGGVVREYRKAKIACRHAEGEGCSQMEECPFYAAAPETLDKNANWYEP